MDHVRIVEAAHDVGDRGHFADVGEELVAEALALVGALHQAGDVDELDRRGHDRRDAIPFGVQLGERREPGVGNGHDADVLVDGGEGVVGRLDASLGDRVEQGALPDVGKAHDADSEHAALLAAPVRRPGSGLVRRARRRRGGTDRPL